MSGKAFGGRRIGRNKKTEDKAKESEAGMVKPGFLRVDCVQRKRDREMPKDLKEFAVVNDKPQRCVPEDRNYSTGNESATYSTSAPAWDPKLCSSKDPGARRAVIQKK